jgi:hypothetical protein
MIITGILLFGLLMIANTVHAFLKAESGHEVPGVGYESDPDA